MRVALGFREDLRRRPLDRPGEFRVQQLLSAAASLDGLDAGDVNVPPLLQGS